MAEAGRKYSQACQLGGKDRSRGPPLPHLLLALLQSLIVHGAVDSQVVDFSKAKRGRCKTPKLGIITKDICVVKQVKMYKSDKKRLLVAVGGGDVLGVDGEGESAIVESISLRHRLHLRAETWCWC